MGLFDFITGAGDKPAQAETVDVPQERIDELRREGISRKIALLDGVEGEQVQVEVSGEVATLSGIAPSQEALEKMVLCAGNQYGIGRVDCQLQVLADLEAPAAGSPAATAGQATVEPTFYTVQSGDTLSKIAKQFYGDPNQYNRIFEANQPMLENPDKIYPGQALRIPTN